MERRRCPAAAIAIARVSLDFLILSPYSLIGAFAGGVRELPIRLEKLLV